MAKYGKRTTTARAAFAGKSMVTVEEAVALIKSVATAKFDESLEIAMNLGVDPRQRRSNGSRHSEPAQRHR